MRKMAWRSAAPVYAAPPLTESRWRAPQPAAPWEGARPAASLAWTGADRRLADTMSSYRMNFAHGGDPNGPGLPAWRAFGATGKARMLGDTVAAETGAAKLTFFDSAYKQQMQGGTHP